MPQDTGFYVDDVCIPHTWYTVEIARNDQFQFNFNSTKSTATVPPGIYEVAGLGAAIAKAVSDQVNSVGAFTSEYNKLQDTITISLASTSNRSTSLQMMSSKLTAKPLS